MIHTVLTIAVVIAGRCFHLLLSWGCLTTAGLGGYGNNWSVVYGATTITGAT